MPIGNRDDVWGELMRASLAGDEHAYSAVLKGITPAIRMAARRGLSRFGAGESDVEDIVQEALLAIHLKRHTWQPSKPLTPWIMAIVRNKLIDSLRRRGHRVHVPIEDFAELLPSEPVEQSLDAQEMSVMLEALQPRQRELVGLIIVQGHSISDVANRLEMKDGAVRVALHRCLKAMAAHYRSRLS